MSLQIPDPGAAGMDLMTRPYAATYHGLANGIAGTECVLFGCDVATSTGLAVSVARGAVLSQGVLRSVAAVVLPVPLADPDYWRIDLVVVPASGAATMRAGAPGALPSPPEMQAGDVLLALVFVPGSAIALPAANVRDRRILRSRGPIALDIQSAELVVSNTLLATSVYSVTIPAGLLAVGRQLMLRMGGNYLSNSGTPTFRWTVQLGGIGYWSDATAATAADTDRGAWDIDLVLTSRTLIAQRITGSLRMQTPGAKTAPTSGVGDIGVATNINAPIWGAAAATMDTLDTVLSVAVTMSVANANVQTVRENATVWLL